MAGYEHWRDPRNLMYQANLSSKREQMHTREKILFGCSDMRQNFGPWTTMAILNVWKPDRQGTLGLDSQYNPFRVQRGHTFSIALGKHLWIATGKEIRVFAPSAKSDTEFHVLRGPLSQSGTGEVPLRCNSSWQARFSLLWPSGRQSQHLQPQ